MSSPTPTISLRQKEIQTLISEYTPANYSKLQEICLKKGLPEDNELRCKTWLYLLNLSNEEEVDLEKASVSDRKDLVQIERDVERSLWTVSDEERPEKRAQLQRIMRAILIENEDLFYYQGYHDIASVFLLVCGEQTAYHILRAISKTFLREQMDETLEATLKKLDLLYPLLRTRDKELVDHIEKGGLLPHFGISWILTWFSHDISDFPAVCRLFDAFIATHPLFSIYLAAALVLHFKRDILETPTEMNELHHTLLKLSAKTIPYHLLVYEASQMLQETPPTALLRLEGASDFKFSSVSAYPYEFVLSPPPVLPLTVSDPKQKSVAMVGRIEVWLLSKSIGASRPVIGAVAEVVSKVIFFYGWYYRPSTDSAK